MSMVESQKAIAKAETVSKLTALAFFFIPLSFIASPFGVNFVVSRSLWLLADVQNFVLKRPLIVRPETQIMNVDRVVGERHGHHILSLIPHHDCANRSKSPSGLTQFEQSQDERRRHSLGAHRQSAKFLLLCPAGILRIVDRHRSGTVEAIHVA